MYLVTGLNNEVPTITDSKHTLAESLKIPSLARGIRYEHIDALTAPFRWIKQGCLSLIAKLQTSKSKPDGGTLSVPIDPSKEEQVGSLPVDNNDVDNKDVDNDPYTFDTNNADLSNLPPIKQPQDRAQQFTPSHSQPISIPKDGALSERSSTQKRSEQKSYSDAYNPRYFPLSSEQLVEEDSYQTDSPGLIEIGSGP